MQSEIKGTPQSHTHCPHGFYFHRLFKFAEVYFSFTYTVCIVHLWDTPVLIYVNVRTLTSVKRLKTQVYKQN